jgi:hypothetical protein
MMVMQAASRLMNQQTLDKLKSIATGEEDKKKKEEILPEKGENSNKDLIEKK